MAQCLTAIAGSSGWFDRGFVTYSNQAKIEMLGVPAATLATHGAVSEATAAAMALGALRHSHADWALALTVTLLAVLFFTLALNLSGVFEVGGVIVPKYRVFLIFFGGAIALALATEVPHSVVHAVERFTGQTRGVEVVDVAGPAAEQVEHVEREPEIAADAVADAQIRQRGRCRALAVVLDQRTRAEVAQLDMAGPGSGVAHARRR